MKQTVEISEKEFAVIREISDNHLPDQRTIASRTGISLGLTNLIIKRLISKGYIKAKQLNRKKIQYLLTPKGFSEKAKKSYSFTQKTISHIKSMKESIQQLVIEQQNRGALEFVVSGNSELADIAELAIRDLRSSTIQYRRTFDDPNGKVVALILVPSSKDSAVEYSIDLITYLANANQCYQ